jgi:histidinol-phosphatase
MPSKELEAALEAAQAASAVIQQFYRRNLTVTIKADKSPVTQADVQAEETIQRILRARFPSYGFFGEESGRHAMHAESIWLVDPLDGTKSFVREAPFFSTQIALMRAGELVLGVSCASVYGETAWAEAGGGAFLDGQRIHTSTVSELSAAFISTGNISTLAASGAAWSRFGALIGRVGRVRGYGDFVHYHLLARGALDVVIESDLNILDIAALAVIVREAGGIFTDLAGQPPSLETRSVLATNAALHAPVLAALTG